MLNLKQLFSTLLFLSHYRSFVRSLICTRWCYFPDTGLPFGSLLEDIHLSQWPYLPKSRFWNLSSDHSLNLLIWSRVHWHLNHMIKILNRFILSISISTCNLRFGILVSSISHLNNNNVELDSVESVSVYGQWASGTACHTDMKVKEQE